MVTTHFCIREENTHLFIPVDILEIISLLPRACFIMKPLEFFSNTFHKLFYSIKLQITRTNNFIKKRRPLVYCKLLIPTPCSLLRSCQNVLAGKPGHHTNCLTQEINVFTQCNVAGTQFVLTCWCVIHFMIRQILLPVGSQSKRFMGNGKCFFIWRCGYFNCARSHHNTHL